MSEKLSMGLESKLIDVFDQLNQKYKYGEHYLLSFHTDNYGGEACYDAPLEVSDDAGGYVVRMSKGSFITVPKESLNDFGSPQFLALWGDKIHKTLKSPPGVRKEVFAQSDFAPRLSREEQIVANIKIASVDFELGGTETQFAYDYFFDGQEDILPRVSYQTYKNGKEGVLDIRKHVGDVADEHDSDDSRFDFSNLFGNSSSQHYSRLLLPFQIPVSIDITAAAGTNLVNVTGLKLRRFSMYIGTGEGSFECKSLNTELCESLNFSIGAATANINGLGNTNTKKINASTRAGRLNLNFDGDLKIETVVNVNVSAGFVTLGIPKRFGVKVYFLGKILSSISLPDMVFSSEGQHYTNRTYGSTESSLVIHVNVGAGRVKIVWL
ncbi:hypothetical protein CHS0354_023824 [Potamilus streckersoni]|uniref:Uncharacterized protein n=1 Tax=Potamilus streckersoni TaxID=2493646 RepID=A0AAE0VMM0_9BIVA|nr:hypothetical protein CHS0354_023824 [Potamilus streckersoni]